MRPPAPADGSARDCLGKRWHRPVRSFEDDTVLTNESKSLVCRHREGTSVRGMAVYLTSVLWNAAIRQSCRSWTSTIENSEWCSPARGPVGAFSVLVT